MLDATNQQIFVHFWGPGVTGVYYIMIIMKIIKKVYFNRSKFRQTSLSNYTLVAIEGTTLRCLILLFPFRRFWNFHVKLKWRHARRWMAFPKRQLLGHRRDNTQRNGEHGCFCDTILAQIRWRMVIFLLWLPMGAVVRPLLLSVCPPSLYCLREYILCLIIIIKYYILSQSLQGRLTNW